MKKIILPILLFVFMSCTTISSGQNGKIKGQIGYPASGIPNDLIINFENIETNKIYQYIVFPEAVKKNFTFLIGNPDTEYEFQLPVGKYFVYATTNKWEKKRAYYSRHVENGMTVDSKDHTPIIVEVKPNKITAGVDPVDWYDKKTY